MPWNRWDDDCDYANHKLDPKVQPRKDGAPTEGPKLYLQDADLTLFQGDALEVLQSLPDGSVQMCVTSPPFYGLRDYACEGQIGLEETPEQWVDNLVGVFREVRRVLRADGTCWVEVGDSYASSGERGNGGNTGLGSVLCARGAGGSMVPAGGKKRERLAGERFGHAATGLKPKDLIGAPWMLAFALRADGWYLRSDIVWSRPNPMPESVTDRPTKSHSYVFLLSKQARYFFDQEAIREAPPGYDRKGGSAPYTADSGHTNGIGSPSFHQMAQAGRNVRSVWQIATQPYPEAHFATYPEELVRRCILAGTSERGCCPECGAPWTRETEDGYVQHRKGGDWQIRQQDERGSARSPAFSAKGTGHKTTSTLGWLPSCDCIANPNPEMVQACTVLDPFFGSGTTGLVARKHGRKTIGIELSSAYCELAARRLQQLSLLA